MYRIILVDDEHIVLKGVKVLLERMDVSAEIIATVQDGKTAYQLIQEMKPDIVITDIRIPFIDGLSLIEMCKETLPNIHYIVISGYQDFEYARRALRLGATDYIDKPLTIEKMQSLFRILDEKEAVKRNEEQIFAEKDKEIIQNSGVESKDMHAAIVIALDYIQNHFTEDIGLLELSDLVDMNPAYLSVLFKEQVGISFIKYLTKLRIERAKELLASGMRASDAGIAVGYNDSHYFYDIFKRNTGMTATEYKEQL